jgi:hypothetical protein
MLAGMSSLAPLAQAAAPAAPAFNSTFYATIATVIPVLFLALAIQGRIYEGLVKAMVTSARWAGGTVTMLLQLAAWAICSPARSAS